MADINPGIYHFPKQEDWEYLVNNIDFEVGKTKESMIGLWKNYCNEFCARILLNQVDGKPKYYFTFAHVSWYGERNVILFDRSRYLYSGYIVDLL